MSATKLTGGCQCGAIRFSCESIGHASICHCRMCQKAFGNVFAPLAAAKGLVWTKREPKRFASSNMVHRGFCDACGTPLTYEWQGDDQPVFLAICAFDDPSDIVPAKQVGEEGRLPWTNDLPSLPGLSPDDMKKSSEFLGRVISYQHPDHDAPDWKPHS